MAASPRPRYVCARHRFAAVSSHRRIGSFLAIKQYGGRERAIPPATGHKTGLPPGVTGYQPSKLYISATGANRVRAQVCTGAGASARVRALARDGARSGGSAGANRKPCKPCFLIGRWRSAALAPPVLEYRQEGPLSPGASLLCPTITIGGDHHHRHNCHGQPGQRRRSESRKCSRIRSKPWNIL